MKRSRIWSALCLMTIWYQLGMSSRYGCLFEKRLCSRDQICSDDGLFGQCQGHRQERVQYQLSVPVLQRLQEVLKRLMLQGLSWQDDITQYVITKELDRVPQSHSPAGPWDSPRPQGSQHLEKYSAKTGYPSSKAHPSVEQLSPAMVQRYLDYVIVPEPAQSSLRVQAPLMDPYTYRQYGYQEEEERSLNSLGGAGYPHHPSQSRRDGRRPGDRDRQLLQDLVSHYLTSAPPSSRHQVAPSFYDDLDLPLDYAEDYISQEEVVSRQQHKKTPPDYNISFLSKQDDRTLQRVAALLERYGIDPRDLTLQQLNSLSAALQLLQAETPDKHKNGVDGKKMELTEAAMTHKSEQAHKPASSPTLAPAQPPATSPMFTVTTAAGVSPTAQGTNDKTEAMETTSKGSTVRPTVASGPPIREEYGYIVTNQEPLSLFDGVRLLETLAERIHLTTSTFINISVVGPALTFRIRQNSQNLSAEDVAEKAVAEKTFLESETGLKIIQTGVGERSDGRGVPTATRVRESSRWVLLTLVGVACVGGILVAAFTIACLRQHARQLASGKLGLGPEGGSETHYEYQELCRQHMAAKSPFGRQDAVAGVSGGSGGGTGGGGGGTDTSRVSSVSSQFSDAPQPSPSSHSSTPSWCEEPAQSNMDISTGHMILAYMEDHLRNKDRLLREWEALCSYQAEPSTVSIAQNESNLKKNRNPEFVPYDHARVKLKAEINPSRTDYINASTIIEHDPRMPAYIATQGPLTHTIPDFWQMVWESGCAVIVMMTALVEDGEKQCDRYWPDEGSSLYHIYEVNLVSEHIWCNDFLVRSFYLKNVQTQETRTLTQFHFLSWPAQGIPTSTRPLLDFRRKVNKCYRGRSCPIIVHCSDGTGRTGTYILIDMVLNRMAKGVKEIDIAATLEHVRDQRPGMVRTKDQFEFALTAVAEEVNAILKALPQ
ncbi:receptor-type tyrosine-protein phosphatase-like N isoform X2 [Brienomyrus brachyistius]|uniref:receptor-type tyrosine-protein phosphatase-like N isoform X2 n=1 Tax=Brienomyrus brachyistius TaxID=42636 RepID=UPI0020B2D462|nr:receptor-type tyrosine-protein phosphatase-like N isoform X2 [Brienomyrus brachyistius]